MIEFKNVTKVYGRGDGAIEALRGVSFCIQKGEFVVLQGPSGSGKSTCMNILGALDTATSGSYFFNEIEVSQLSRKQLALLRRYNLGFIFQGFNLLSRTSAMENVELPLVYRGVPSYERHKIAKAALAIVGLTGWELHTPSELSGGQQQRVAIARAIVTEPSILLADEPTGNLDTVRGKEILQLLKQLNTERGITIIMVTHDKAMASFADRDICVIDGLIASSEGDSE